MKVKSVGIFQGVIKPNVIAVRTTKDDHLKGKWSKILRNKFIKLIKCSFSDDQRNLPSSSVVVESWYLRYSILRELLIK
jgi:hypothetical protein